MRGGLKMQRLRYNGNDATAACYRAGGTQGDGIMVPLIYLLEQIFTFHIKLLPDISTHLPDAMSDVRLTIVYYSTYGTNYAMAQVAAEAAREAGAEVRLRKVRETVPQSVIDAQEGWKAAQAQQSGVPEATTEDMEWANAYFLSAPTRFGGAASQMRAFIDTLGGAWQKGALANKAFTAMTSAQNPHGGQETTLQTLYITAMHWSAVLVPPGYTSPAVFASGGNPYGVSVTATGEGLTDEDIAAIQHQAKRVVEVAAKLA